MVCISVYRYTYVYICRSIMSSIHLNFCIDKGPWRQGFSRLYVPLWGKEGCCGSSVKNPSCDIFVS